MGRGARWRGQVAKPALGPVVWLWVPPVLVLLLALVVGRSPRCCWDRALILGAIRFVETGARADPPDGDDGRAIGPFQIHRAYWPDAVEFEPALGGRYEDCRDLAYAARIVDSYMRRWVPDAWARGDAEVVARTHNGGPRGAERAATDRYWRRVRASLERQGPALALELPSPAP